MYRLVIQLIPDQMKGLIDLDQIQTDEIFTGRLNVTTKNKNVSKQDNHNELVAPIDPEDVNLICLVTPKSYEVKNKPDPDILNRIKISVTDKIEKIQKSKNARRLGLLKDLLISQLAKLSLYQDINFIMTCYYCDLQSLFILSLLVSIQSIVRQLIALS